MDSCIYICGRLYSILVPNGNGMDSVPRRQSTGDGWLANYYEGMYTVFIGVVHWVDNYSRYKFF